MAEVDLNLLRVFDTLYELRSVTRAASRLGLTQSAVSHALRRLRDAIDDPLFVRAPGGLQPTARAVEIAPGVREGLVQLRGALSPTIFDPATATRNFTIAAGSYFCALLVPELLRRVRVRAPRVVLRVVPLGAELLSELDDSIVDIALGAFSRIPPRLVTAPLFHEDLVWIAAGDNPLAHGPIDLAALPDHPRLAISVGRPFEALKAIAAEGVLERKSVADATGQATVADRGDECAAVYDALTATAIVGQTDLVALVPRRFAERDADRFGFVVLDEAGQGDGIDLMMLWHNKFDEDAGLAWLRDVIAGIASAL